MILFIDLRKFKNKNMTHGKAFFIKRYVKDDSSYSLSSFLSVNSTFSILGIAGAED